MATVNQRSASIADALVNGTSTQAQRQRILASFGSAEIFIREIRHFVLSKISNTESEAQVQAARQMVESTVTSDFTELP